MPYVPIEWLGQHVDLPKGLSAQELAQSLVKVGIEEEAIHAPAVTGPLVIGKVLTKEPKEQKNGKLINYCRVDVGEHNDAPGTGAEPSDIPSRGIICGAQNFVEGDYVVVALPGTVLPGNFSIAARKTYGHISDGMMCSRTELGLGDESDGIIILQKEYPGLEIPKVGSDAKAFLGLPGELIEINITPDRGYCFSMRGVAREYSHATGAKYVDPGLAENLPGGEVPQGNSEGFPVEISDEAPIYDQLGCDRFVARIVRGIDPNAQSPEWMQNFILQAGMRPISLAVDITNYVMLDIGQPIHAYDLNKVVAPLVVRRARPDESLVTLDGVERKLDPEDLLITDSANGHSNRVLSLAGVMGGVDTEIDPKTNDVLIEAAHFDSISIARTSRRHKLPSEAAKRNERGTDPNLPAVAAQRCVDLLIEYGGGTADKAVTDLNLTKEVPPMDFRISEAKRLTGVNYSSARVKEILEMIGCSVTEKNSEEITVRVPSWRPDLLGGSAHLVEEIARIDGYDQIPSVLYSPSCGTGITPKQRKRREVATILAEQGWVQVISYPFIGDVHKDMNIPLEDSRQAKVKLSNPLAEDMPYLRTSILDTLLSTARRNLSRGNVEVAIFEMDTVVHPTHLKTVSLPKTQRRPNNSELQELWEAGKQPWHLAAVASGFVTVPNTTEKPRTWDWVDIIQSAKDVLQKLGLEVEVQNCERAPWHPGRCASLSINNDGITMVLGYAGEIHPKVCDNLELPNRTVAFELDLDKAFSATNEYPRPVKPVSVFPLAKEDFAFVIPQEIPADTLPRLIKKTLGDLAESTYVFDVFTGPQIGEGMKSVAVSLSLRAPDHTISAQEISEARNRVVKAAKKIGANLRKQ